MPILTKLFLGLAFVAPGAFPCAKREGNEGETGKKGRTSPPLGVYQELSMGKQSPVLLRNGIFRPCSEMRGVISEGKGDGGFIAHLGKGERRNDLLLF